MIYFTLVVFIDFANVKIPNFSVAGYLLFSILVRALQYQFCWPCLVSFKASKLRRKSITWVVISTPPGINSDTKQDRNNFLLILCANKPNVIKKRITDI